MCVFFSPTFQSLARVSKQSIASYQEYEWCLLTMILNSLSNQQKNSAYGLEIFMEHNALTLMMHHLKNFNSKTRHMFVLLKGCGNECSALVL